MTQLTDPTMTAHRPGVEAEAVEARQRTMVLAGTHPMIADRLARDAAANQVLRDRHGKAEPEAASAEADGVPDFKA